MNDWGFQPHRLGRLELKRVRQTLQVKAEASAPALMKLEKVASRPAQ